MIVGGRCLGSYGIWVVVFFYVFDGYYVDGWFCCCCVVLFCECDFVWF